jgi:hypothetical protein
MQKRIVFGLALVLLVASLGEVDAQLDENRFGELMELVVPAEKTQSVDWLPDLLAAQKAALEQGKPLFIWSMDGHPLGCV